MIAKKIALFMGLILLGVLNVEAALASEMGSPPKRVISANGSTTEMMLKLGLEKHLVGTAFLDNPVLPELAAAYKRVPVLSDRYPGKELVLYLEPDFILGWQSVFADRNLGPSAYWNRLGIKTMTLRNSRTSQPRVENCLEDIKDLGRLFQVEDKAEALVEQISGELALVEKKVAGRPTKPRVLLTESEDRWLFEAYGENSLLGQMLIKAGGQNIFLKSGFYSLEDLLSADPEVLIFLYKSSELPELSARLEKVRNHPSLKQVQAVKNNRLHTLALADAYCPGIRVGGGVKSLALALYPELFNEN